MTDDFTPGADELLFLPLGGTGEIGMNLNLYGHAGKWLMVDLGVTFGEESLPGIDVVMADPQFILERRDQLAGLVLTHAHEDHIGAVPYLWPELGCPIYATPFTAALLRRKFADDDMEDPPEITVVPMSGTFSVGPFEIELVTLTHSIPEPNAVVLRTPPGMVLHTGDWKLDPDPLVGDDYDAQRLREIAEEGVLAMVCDSTNALVEGESGSELDAREGLQALIAEQTGRIAVACFASNVARLESIMRVAEACGRRVSLIGRSMHRIVASAREVGYLRDIPALIDPEDIGYLPRDEVLLLCTGSQGETRAALWRIAQNNHPDITLEAGDTVVFSSRVIPGNEKGIFALYNALIAAEVTVYSDDACDLTLHVSGHPCRGELAQMYQWVRPKVSIPVHGERRHLTAHAELARRCQVPEAIVSGNGDLIRLAPGKAEIVATVETGRLLVDGDIVRRSDSPALKNRRRMAYSGSAVVTAVFDGDGAQRGAPRLLAGNLLEAEEDEDIAEAVLAAVQVALGRLGRQARRDPKAVGEAMRLAARRTITRLTGRRAIVEAQPIFLD